jgi:hypothetical protein
MNAKVLSNYKPNGVDSSTGFFAGWRNVLTIMPKKGHIGPTDIPA